MTQVTAWLSWIADKAGSTGSVISAMGCAFCFPALASLGATIGLGFLSQYEGLLVNTLLPLFAGIALLANIIGWFGHRLFYRTLLGLIGPVLVLATLYPLWQYNWSTYLFYSGLAFMLVVSLRDIFLPPPKYCKAGNQKGAGK